VSGGLTTEQIVARNPLPRFVPVVLADEQRRGRVELVGGRWRLTEAFIETYWAAFGCLTGPRPTTSKGDQRP
jgi:hypothetical protein